MTSIPVEVRHEAGYWVVYVHGIRIVDRESYTIANRIAGYLQRGDYDNSESSEVAESIRVWAGRSA